MHGSVHTKAVGTSVVVGMRVVVGTSEGEAFGAGAVAGAVVGSGSVAAIGISTCIMVAGAASNGSVAPCADLVGSVAGQRRCKSAEFPRDLSRSVEGARLRAEIGDLSMTHGSARPGATRAAEAAAAEAAGANAR